MRISFITTVFNEVDSIGNFLESVLKQTRSPDEIVVVDGISTDGTERIVEKMAKDDQRIRLIRAECGVSEGRNIAIRAAQYDIIAVSDAGCVLNDNWLEELTKPFGDGDVCVSAGYHTPVHTNRFSRVCAELLTTKEEKIDLSRLSPSSRSIAFRKKCWEEVAGYPDTQYYGEDSLFNKRLRKNGCRIVFSSRARVAWTLRPDLMSFIRQYYKYSYGDAYLLEKKRENLIRLLVHGYSYGNVVLLGGLGIGALNATAALSAYYGLLYSRRVKNSQKPQMKDFPLAMAILAAREHALTAGYVAGFLRRMVFERE
ncbi:MAG: glycosyltransferase [Proteobacteria bacterium]|nr:glycosyltransferase [Pseudomonadota bacterium]